MVSTWQSHEPIFNEGAHYRAVKSFMSWNSVFIAGEELTFLSGGHSWYDDSDIYEFHSHLDGTSKVWMLHRASSASCWTDFFEAVDGKEA